MFYPGGMGIQFIKQYAQAGLRDQIPLYSVFTVDETTLPALKDAAIGQYEARFWSPDLKVPASQKLRRRLPEEVRLHALVLRRAELRRHHADRLGGARRPRAT